jgi:hypothetical protein
MKDSRKESMNDILTAGLPADWWRECCADMWLENYN